MGTEPGDTGRYTCYPIALNIGGQRCLVIGGDRLATEKVDALLAAGAVVVVVTLSALPQLHDLAAAGRITLHLRPYEEDDLWGSFLVIAAADRDLNARIADDARSAGILVNAVDDPPNCDFFAMALVRRGDLQVAISTNGLSPAFARYMREEIDEWLPSEYAGLLEALGQARAALRARGDVPAYEHWRSAITPELLVDLQEGRVEQVRDRVLDALRVPA